MDEYAGKPVVFVAVMSGLTQADVEGYVQYTGLKWPVLVDDQRRTEETFLDSQISLNNIFAYVVITPEGEALTIRGGPDAAKGRIDKLLPKARFFFDGLEIPAKLKDAAAEIELGQFAGAAGKIAKAAGSGPKKDREAAHALWDRLIPVAEAALKRAAEIEKEGRLFAAYQEYLRVSEWFDGTEVAKAGKKEADRLKRTKAVTDELNAQRLVEQGKAALATGNRGNALAAFEAARRQYPDTQAGKEAAELLKAQDQ